MTLFSIISSLRAQARAQRSDAQPADSKLALRLSEVFRRTWDLGFTAFGGPPVHFQILHRRFVEGLGFQGGSKWIDEQTVSSTVCVLRSATDRCATVSRVVRNMSSTSWSSVHKDALQHHADSCWARLGGLCLFAMELAWGNWYVWVIARCTEDARSIATHCVCFAQWNERKYCRDYCIGRRAGA
jgi:hypothetical protein